MSLLRKRYNLPIVAFLLFSFLWSGFLHASPPGDPHVPNATERHPVRDHAEAPRIGTADHWNWTHITVTASASNSGAVTCTHPSTTITARTTASGTTTYSWTGPNSFTATGSSITVSTAGTYTVTGTNSGKTGSCNVTVTTDTATPAPLEPGNTGPLTCSNDSVSLIMPFGSSTGITVSWAGPNGFTSTDAFPNVGVPGTYYLVVTSTANGCSTLNPTIVTQDTAAPRVTIGSATGTMIINCTNPTLNLTAGATPQSVTYAWSGPNSFTAATATALVTIPGTYTATATSNSNGCTKTASVLIAIDTAHPAAVTTSSLPANAILTCTSPSIALSGSSNTPGVNYLWTGSNGFSVASANVTATGAGSYICTVTNPNNGCSSASPATVVTSNTVVPVGVTANASNKITCTVPTTTLTGNSTTTGATFTWAGPGGFTSTSKSTTVSLGGVYTFTAINADNGCTISKTVTVVADTATPAGVTATNSGPLTCNVTTVTLTGNSTTSGVTYIWTGPNGFFDPEQISSSATDSGTYVLSVQNPENGCSSTASTYVAQDLSACEAIRRTATAGKANAVVDPASSGVGIFMYKVYPNPVSRTTANIEFTAQTSTMVSVELYNTSGIREQVLFSHWVEANQSYRVTLNRSELASGIHYCMIRSNGKMYTTKLLILQ